MKYWYYVYSYEKTRGTTDFPVTALFQSDVFRGNFADLVLHIHEQNDKDQNYTDFRLVNWQTISRRAFRRLDGIIG